MERPAEIEEEILFRTVKVFCKTQKMKPNLYSNKHCLVIAVQDKVSHACSATTCSCKFRAPSSQKFAG